MGAYIINVPSTVDRIIYVHVDANGKTAVVSQQMENLTPYTEPDLEQVRKEAYKDGYNAGFGKKIHTSYQEGLSDAWEAARKICTNWVLPDSVLSKIFGMDKTIDDIMKENKASEAIEKIRQYEQRQEEQIQVGDEVIYNGTTRCVVYSPENDKRYASIIDTDGVNYSADHRELTKTGRHFPEIAEVIAKMKETDNG